MCIHVFRQSYIGIYVFISGINKYLTHMYESIYVSLNICMNAPVYVCVCIYAISMYAFRFVYL